MMSSESVTDVPRLSFRQLASRPLVGREVQTELLAWHRAEAARGRGAVVRIVGDPGAGKTALLNSVTASARAEGLRVVSTHGNESEQHLPFAALHRLVEPLSAGLDTLPATHRAALNAAFGLDAADRVPQPFFVALAVLELMTAAAADGALLVTVDDRQWLDPATHNVVDFVARRVDGERILMVVCERALPEADVVAPGIGTELELCPLDPTASARLLDAAHPSLASGDRHSILHIAAGNPLVLVELPRGVLGAAAVPPGRGLRDVFASRVAALPDRARLPLLVSALCDGDTSDEASAILTVMGGGSFESAVRGAVAAGLVTVQGARVRFVHPLVRAAVIAQASDDDRRSVHEALATAVDVSPPPPFAEPATALERGVERDDAAFARDLFERAVRISTDKHRRSHRLLRVGELALELGLWDDVKPILAHVRSVDLIPVDRARLVALELAFDDGAPESADAVHRFVESARDAMRAGDDRLAVDLLVVAARNTYWGASADTLGPVILDSAAQLGDDVAIQRLVLVIESFLRPFQSGAMLVEQLGQYVGLDLNDETYLAFSQAALVVGDFELALEFAERADVGLRRDGRFAPLAGAFVLQSVAAIYLGRWDLTETTAHEARTLALETRQPVWAGIAQLAQANLLAFRGRRAEAEAEANDVEAFAVLTGNASVASAVQLARGLAALGAGDADAAFAEFARMYDRADLAWQVPQNVWAIDYFAEAALASGNREAARSVLTQIELLTAGTPASGVLRAVSLATLILADDDEVERAYDDASRVAATPWHRARRDLAYGSWLRRHRDGTAAQALLTSAAAIFEALEARAWADRANSELDAAGVRRPARAQPELWSTLSAQELQVAMLAAEGMSNREIAARLYLSHRTVSSHLYHAYPKLGIKSRAQLHLALKGVG